MTAFGTDEKKADLAITILERSVVFDAEKQFCQSYYTLEQSSLLIFTAAKEIERMEEVLKIDVEMTRVEAALPRIIQLLTESRLSVETVKSASETEPKKCYCCC